MYVSRLLHASVIALGLVASVDARAAVTLYSEQTAFLAALPSAQVSLFDFETSSGYPAAGAGPASYVGNVGGVTFVGVTNTTLAIPPGTQVFSGLQLGFGCCFGVGTIDFTSLPQQPYAFGFFGGDLTVDEIIRVVVGFDDGSATSYSVDLNGQPAFTETFFGLVDSARTVRFLQIFGANATSPDSATRAWVIDDLTIAAIPEPSTWAVLGAGLLVLAGVSRWRSPRVSAAR
jgi:hypothetical protein